MDRFYLLFIPLLTMILLVSCGEEFNQPLSLENRLVISFNQGDHSISFIDGERFKEVARWHWEEPITGGLLLPNHEQLLLYGKEMPDVLIIDLATGEESTRWPIGPGIVNAELSIDGTTIYFADHQQNRLRLFTTAGEELNHLQGGERPYTMLVGEEHLYLYHYYDHEIGRVDLTQLEYDFIFPTSPFPFGGLYRTAAEELWVGGHGAGTEVEEFITVYDAEDGQLKTTIKTPYMPIAFTEWRDFIFALSHGASTLYQIDPTTYQVLNSLQVGSNASGLISDEEHLYISSLDTDEIYVVTPELLTIEAVINVGKQPFQLLLREGDR